ICRKIETLPQEFTRVVVVGVSQYKVSVGENLCRHRRIAARKTRPPNKILRVPLDVERGLSLLATHAYVFSETFLYRIPRYQRGSAEGLKKPSSKAPPGDTSVLLLEIVRDSEDDNLLVELIERAGRNRIRTMKTSKDETL
ncbi:unnamed protein product, partial [Brassica oleracea]